MYTSIYSLTTRTPKMHILVDHFILISINGVPKGGTGEKQIPVFLSRLQKVVYNKNSFSLGKIYVKPNVE